MMVANVGAEPTAYAEYQDGVLVFRYGEKKYGCIYQTAMAYTPFIISVKYCNFYSAVASDVTIVTPLR